MRGGVIHLRDGKRSDARDSISFFNRNLFSVFQSSNMKCERTLKCSAVGFNISRLPPPMGMCSSEFTGLMIFICSSNKPVNGTTPVHGSLFDYFPRTAPPQHSLACVTDALNQKKFNAGNC
jgi:hypothetical protein